MWYCPEKYELEQANVNAELAKLKGDLDNKEARTLLNTRHNLDHIYFDYVDWFHEYNEKYNNYML